VRPIRLPQPADPGAQTPARRPQPAERGALLHDRHVPAEFSRAIEMLQELETVQEQMVRNRRKPCPIPLPEPLTSMARAGFDNSGCAWFFAWKLAEGRLKHDAQGSFSGAS
jgi:hypothetical protein